jgi:hypothetical protein
MSSRVVSLPSRFPVGTRYVIEGRAGRIELRYLEFPDGRHVELPAELAERARSRAPAAGRRRQARRNFEKKLKAGGTTRQLLR